LKNDSWAIGPKFGINMSWFFFKNFMILAKGAVDIMFASNKISGVHVLTGAANISPILNPNLSKHKKYILRDVENFSLGLGWGSYFRSNRYNFNLAVSYEIQRYSNTNYMAAYDETFGSTQFLDFTKQINPGDLFLHGITVTSRFDF